MVKSGARFTEGSHPFLLVGGVEQRREDLALEAHTLGQRRLERDIQSRLRRVQRRKRFRRDGLSDLAGFVEQVGGGHDPRDQAGPLGLSGIHHPPQ